MKWLFMFYWPSAMLLTVFFSRRWIRTAISISYISLCNWIIEQSGILLHKWPWSFYVICVLISVKAEKSVTDSAFLRSQKVHIWTHIQTVEIDVWNVLLCFMELAFLLSCFDPVRERSGRPCTAWQSAKVYSYPSASGGGGGRVVRWCRVNFQCRGVLQTD